MQDAEDLQSRLKTHTVNIFVHKLLKCWVLLSLQHIEEYKDRTCCHAELWLWINGQLQLLNKSFGKILFKIYLLEKLAYKPTWCYISKYFLVNSFLCFKKPVLAQNMHTNMFYWTNLTSNDCINCCHLAHFWHTWWWMVTFSTEGNCFTYLTY